eukprot:TCONS_00001499-protein
MANNNNTSKPKGLYYEDERIVVNAHGMRAGLMFPDCYVVIDDCRDGDAVPQDVEMKSELDVKVQSDPEDLHSQSNFSNLSIHNGLSIDDCGLLSSENEDVKLEIIDEDPQMPVTPISTTVKLENVELLLPLEAVLTIKMETNQHDTNHIALINVEMNSESFVPENRESVVDENNNGIDLNNLVHKNTHHTSAEINAVHTVIHEDESIDESEDHCRMHTEPKTPGKNCKINNCDKTDGVTENGDISNEAEIDDDDDLRAFIDVDTFVLANECRVELNDCLRNEKDKTVENGSDNSICVDKNEENMESFVEDENDENLLSNRTISRIKKHFTHLEKGGDEISFRIVLKSNSRFYYKTCGIQKIHENPHQLDEIMFFEETSSQPNIRLITELYALTQNQSQQYLINKYPTILFISQIQTVDCIFSLFLLYVRTNVDCQIVGTILCNNNNNQAKVLKEALTEFKKINSFWTPKYVVIDPNQVILNTAEEVFPDSELFFDPEMCVYNWEKHLSNPLNGLREHSEQLFHDLKALQMCSKKGQYHDLVQEMRDKNICNDRSFREEWLMNAKKWVFLPNNLQSLLREDWIVECKKLYETTLEKHSNELDIFDLLLHITDIIPTSRFQRYCLKNRELYINVQNSFTRKSIRKFGLPLFMISNCAAILSKYKNTSTHTTVVNISHRTYEVVDGEEMFTIHLGNQREFPSCTCAVWKTYSIPCKHIFRVLKKYSLDYDSLSPIYRASPYFDIDFSCMEKVNKDTARSMITFIPSKEDILKSIRNL